MSALNVMVGEHPRVLPLSASFSIRQTQRASSLVLRFRLSSFLVVRLSPYLWDVRTGRADQRIDIRYKIRYSEDREFCINGNHSFLSLGTDWVMQK